MEKRGAQCPMCNGSLNRRTVHRNFPFANMITCFHKIEEAIKADIHIDIAAYQVHPQSKEASGENAYNPFPKMYSPALGSSKRNQIIPRIISETKLSSRNSILNYVNFEEEPQSSSGINQSHKALDQKTDIPDYLIKKAMDAPVKNISKSPNARFNQNNSAQKTSKTKLDGKVKSERSLKTRKMPEKIQNDKKLTFKQVHQRLRDREKSIASTSVDSEKKAKDPFCDSETEKITHVKASTEVAKKTWSRVKKFGKEMRPLKKKSLNVSIESKSHSTAKPTSKKKFSTEIGDSQDIFATVLEKNPLNLNHSFSEAKDGEDLISRLSSKEVNDIIGVVSEEDSETDSFTPQDIIDNKSPEKCGSMTDYFKGCRNMSSQAQIIMNDKAPQKDEKSTPEQIIEDTNPEDEQNENLLTCKRSQMLVTQSSDETKSYKISPEVPKMILTAVEIPPTNKFPEEQIDSTLLVEQMDLTLPVSSVQSDKKNNKSNYLREENSQNFKDVEAISQTNSLSKNATKNAARKVSNLSSKIIYDKNAKSFSAENNADSCKLSLTKVAKTFVPFKKLGRICLKKHRRIPFYYLGRLSNKHNYIEKSNVTMLSPTKSETKHIKRNFSFTNLSDSGFSRTRGNLTPENQKINKIVQGLERTSSGTVVLLSPQNDSQLKHLSIGSPHKERELSVLKTSIISKKDHFKCSSNILERQKGFTTPGAKKNMAKKSETLLQECEELDKEEELIAEKELMIAEKGELIAEKKVQHPDYKKLFLDGSDFDIDTDKFHEFADEAEFAANKLSGEEDPGKRKQEEPKLLQDTDSESIIPSSLDRPPKKLKLTSENVMKPTFFHRPDTTESLQQRFANHEISQRSTNSNQNVESLDIADRFFEDVIEKSKRIRANTSVDNVVVNIEPSPTEIKMTEHQEINFFKTKTNELDKNIEKASNSIKNTETLNKSEITSELLKENEEMQIDPFSIYYSLHVNAHCHNNEMQNLGSDKENTLQYPNEIESSQLCTHNVEPTQALLTSFVRIDENLEIKETNLQDSGDITEVCRSPTLEKYCTTDRKNRNEEMLNASKNKIIATLPDSLMNITEEQLLLNEFEKELFGGANKACEDPRSENDLVAETLNDYDHLDIIENTPKDNKNMDEKKLLDKDCFEFSPIPSVGLSQDKIVRGPFIQPSIKRKSYPIYHSTPKIPRTISPKCATSLISDILLSSVPKPGLLLQEKMEENSVMLIPKLTFVCSGLSMSQIDSVKQLAKLVKADFTSSFNPNVTHVIVKVTGPKNAAEKTLKFVQGIAHRKWIVSVKWALDSLQESKLLSEEKYEAVDNLTLEEGPKKSRLRRRGIFEDFLCMCKGPFNNVSIEEYWDLLIHTGATLVDTMDALTAEKKKLKILVVQGDHWDDKTIKEWFKKTEAVPIAHEWIVECISQYKLVSIFDYLQAIMPQDVSAVGFPEELLLDEEYESDCEYED
ncbi:breast cancer type 1 susceptibility protein homolog isoform X2 [Belonocnema kinseyi]|nr:breast cancer type 1 susceptibility protein homolog isoform X2 [Belonocnema kinseyi]